LWKNQLAQPIGFLDILRGTVTGQKAGPPLFESMEIIGRGKVLGRIKTAIVILSRQALQTARIKKVWQGQETLSDFLVN
jgi:hypothetical protein